MSTQNLLTFAASLAKQCTVFTEFDPEGSAFIGEEESPVLCAFPAGDKWTILTKEKDLLAADTPPDGEEGPFVRLAAESALSYPPASFLSKKIASAEPPVTDASDSMLDHYHEWWLEAHPFFRSEEGPYLQLGGYPLEWDEANADGELIFIFFDGNETMVEAYDKEGEITIYISDDE